MICSLAVNVASPVLVLTLKACTKPDRDWQPLPTFADLARPDDGLDLSLSRPVRARLSSSAQTRLGPSGDGRAAFSSVWCITTVGRPCHARIGEIGVHCLLPIVCPP
jgi:hypothetical protein